MRTTFTIEDDVAKLVEIVRRARSASSEEIVNQALRQGLNDMTKPPRRGKEHETRSVSLGRCQLVNLDDITEVTAVAEGETYK